MIVCKSNAKNLGTFDIYEHFEIKSSKTIQRAKNMFDRSTSSDSLLLFPEKNTTPGFPRK